jgi:hypothetical protein
MADNESLRKIQAKMRMCGSQAALTETEAVTVMDWLSDTVRQNLERVYNVETLDATTLHGACNDATSLALHHTEALGLRFDIVKAADLFPDNTTPHFLGVVTLPVAGVDGEIEAREFLFDRTYGQFVRPKGGYRVPEAYEEYAYGYQQMMSNYAKTGRNMAATEEGTQLQQQLLDKGYLPLTPETALHYARSFSPQLTEAQEAAQIFDSRPHYTPQEAGLIAAEEYDRYGIRFGLAEKERSFVHAVSQRQQAGAGPTPPAG